MVGTVDCIDHGRRHTDVIIGGCDLKKAALWIVVPDDVAGPELDVERLRGATIAVTGKIASSMLIPQITIKSTGQIVARTPVGPNYLASAMDKQSQGDANGAIADLDRAIEQTHEPSLYIQRAEAKVSKGDLDGAIHDYDELIQRYPDQGVYYLKRARLKSKQSDYNGTIANSARAVELFTQYYASHPNDHSTFMLAQAYSERGDAELAKGDAGQAAADYQMAIKNDALAPVYKEKFRKAKREWIPNPNESVSPERPLPGAQLSAVSRNGQTGLVNQDATSDAQIKQKLLGYWQSPRHGYHIASNGVIYMCPRSQATTTNHWNVKGGKFYWDNEPHVIVTLNDKKFVYREIGGGRVTFTLTRGTKEEVDPD